MMGENGDRYPVASLHAFMEEATDEFKRFRLQARLSIVGSLVLFILLARFLLFISVTYGPEPLHIALRRGPFILDAALLSAALAFVLWSVTVWRRQRKFVARWGERFEKLEALETALLHDKAPAVE